MQAVTSYTAALCEGEKATWCKGGCGKFRYPYCKLEDRPICPDCAGRLRLQVIAPPRSKDSIKHQLKVVRSNRISILPIKPRLVAARICLLSYQYQLLIFGMWWLTLFSPPTPRLYKRQQAATANQLRLRSQLKVALAESPKSSVELVSELGTTYKRLENLAAILMKRHEIIGAREHSSRSCWWYGLPHQSAALSEKVGVCAKSLILKHLKGGALSAKDLHDLMPCYDLKWLSVLLWQMAGRCEIIGKGYNRQRVYALPGNDSGLQQRFVRNPLNTKILSILTQNPNLCINDISRKADAPLTTTCNRLDFLEKHELVAHWQLGNKKIYYVVQKP